MRARVCASPRGAMRATTPRARAFFHRSRFAGRGSCVKFVVRKAIEGTIRETRRRPVGRDRSDEVSTPSARDGRVLRQTRVRRDRAPAGARGLGVEERHRRRYARRSRRPRWGPRAGVRRPERRGQDRVAAHPDPARRRAGVRNPAAYPSRRRRRRHVGASPARAGTGALRASAHERRRDCRARARAPHSSRWTCPAFAPTDSNGDSP